MTKNLLLRIAILLLFSLGYNHKTFAQSEKTILFYNVENLFDTLDTPNKDDHEFLPQGEKNWNTQKYFEKIAHINQVLDSTGNPSVIGLCEIENQAVVRDIILYSPHMKQKYGVVHYESEDGRGIDVALMYDSSLFKLQSSGFLRYKLEDSLHPDTRDILWAKLMYKKECFYFMVNHWPSRRGGEEASDKNRVLAAQTARLFIDSIQNSDPTSQIIFMGDLNDYPTNNAPLMIQEKLTPMITKSSGEFGGSYQYKNEWDVLDHIFVSAPLLKKKKSYVVTNSGKIYSFDFIMSIYKNNPVPYRTYAREYLGGYSDHLPVSIKIYLK
jgi:predicted extracellular nuclease